ncbi:hypothetical protein [Chryseobacterium sp. PMSZPI]|uniref:hypothetical protein n=1 Tax=Chryseobacterium sp. PMSZPI TaxID=1033900 RepID=UPI000C32666E|nr:hypothetical protein [Chryseobacterium sp. PMSZPI]PKF73655.1 hypothetical protein CW752_13250 [Chryseobacterium sp. PMSZPI]
MKNFIQDVFAHVLENPVFDEILIETYFSKDYVQFVDHLQLDYEDFVLHIKKLKEKISKQSIEILHYAENGNIIFTNHHVESLLKDGSMVKHKVLAEFTIQNGKIIQCDELTLLLEGSQTEKNLGSEM